MDEPLNTSTALDRFTQELFDDLFAPGQKTGAAVTEAEKARIDQLVAEADTQTLTAPIIDLFTELLALRKANHISPEQLDLSRQRLADLAIKHQQIDEHGVSVGGRVSRAHPIVQEAIERVDNYLDCKTTEAPSGIELWEQITVNAERIKAKLKITDDAWNSYSGQISHCIDSVDILADIVDLPPQTIQEVGRVTSNYRMRLTPYYASLIQTGRPNDPVLLQSVPTAEMVDNVGVEIPPVAADHSPARLIDQFYPRVVTIKVTNMCAMYCTHCLRLAHIGKKRIAFTPTRPTRKH